MPAAYKAALQNFFESDLCFKMLDELYWIQRPEKVAGLNALGREMNWSPNVEGLVESELVPVTLVGVRYRIDLRAWYRALEFQNRTKAEPFKETLADLTVIGGASSGYEGVKDDDTVEVTVPDEIPVTNP